MNSLNILNNNPFPDIADKILTHSVSFFFAHLVVVLAIVQKHLSYYELLIVKY